LQIAVGATRMMVLRTSAYFCAPFWLSDGSTYQLERTIKNLVLDLTTSANGEARRFDVVRVKSVVF
jgi:hypothetical protein